MSVRIITVLALSLGLLGPSAGLHLGKYSGKTASEDDFWPKLLKAKKTVEEFDTTDTTTVNPVGNAVSDGNAKFVLVSQPRSGARFVVEMLNSHPRLRCGYEELHKCCAKGESSEGLTCDDGAMQEVLDKWFTDGGFWQEHPGIKGRGFQVHLNAGLLRRDGSPTGVRDYLVNHDDIKVVFLWRRNELRRHISIAAKTDQFAEQGVQLGLNLSRIAHPMQEEDVKNVREFRPSLTTGAHLVSKLRHGKAERIHAKAVLRDVADGRKITLFYEDLLSSTNPNYDDAWQQLQEFLGVPTVPATNLTASSTHVHMQGEIADLLKNAEEVRTSLVGTEFEPMLM